MTAEIPSCQILTGHVEVVITQLGGHIRPINVKDDRVYRRKKEHQNGRRFVLGVMREPPGRTLPSVALSEAEGVSLVNENVDCMAALSCDEATHWDAG